ncbi:crotonobetainyl-CoA:carnitine CoA-transferase CaiB-like acyl-CoA transferase [Rhodococcus wratislaviensis]|uniref:CaiB/BaiF family protein n=2 Tax=Rhodococcus wratislaviensis TaxID=44752 RepID=A0AB38F5Y7_RHOWR|nr:CoA transferase [Rhodococcus wratislaviensis]REE70742.1 crotonobetainyl-CoA:carnitine CoA-transferase CaiB-like acyl-CoA transferase [Rhodococcus wratislaviensis]SPZ34875.1 CaiB/BaiF family protein [Rhodococcus wratislaviensis]
MNQPLDGVRVVDFGQFIAAPAATQILVDLGADVIKVEPVTGEAARTIGLYGEAILRTYNRGKRAVAVDLATPRGQQLAHRLIADADIVVQNLRPGVMERFGLGAAAVRAAHPQVIYATVSGFGLHGPSKQRAGLDIAAQAESGIMWVTGEADGEPQRVGFPVVDAAAAQVFAQAILGAYVRRLRFGTGDEVEVSLLEVAVHLQGPNWGEYLLTGKPPVRSGNGQPTVAPAADIMPTLDGAIVLSAYSAPHFAKLCELIARPDLARDERFESNAARVRNRSALLIELRAAFADQSTDQAMDLLTPNGIVAGRISSYDEVRKNPDVEATGLFIEVDGTDGTQHTTLGAPWNLGSVPSSSRAGAPTLGQHTAEILGRLGYSPEDIADLQAQRVIHLP